MSLSTRFLGHAALLFRTDHVSLVTDPWFSKQGAFLNSWHQFPDNSELPSSVMDEVRAVDYVLLSHEHQDHFDLGFLKTVNPRAKIIIPKFSDDYLYKTLRENLPNPIEVVESRKTIELAPDLKFTSVVQSVPIWDDSTMIFESNGLTLINANDMKLARTDHEWITARFACDYLFAQFSGANWHPFVYDYALGKKAEIAKEKIYNKFRAVKNLAQSLKAGYLIPCAGPAAFLDPAHFELNFSEASTFPSQLDFFNWSKEEGFDDRMLVMVPGDALPEGKGDTETVRARTQRALQHPAYSDRRAYLEAYRSRRADVIESELSKIQDPGKSLGDACKDYFQPLVSSSPFFRRKLAGKFVLESTGLVPETFVIDFSKSVDSVTILGAGEKGPEDWFYRFRIESRFLDLIFRRELTWEQLFLSLRFEASRNPDQYSEYLTVFLRFADPSSYRAYERYQKERERAKLFEETFELRHEGKSYTVQRLCPHAMGDMSQGRVENGHIICPHHGWAFSLEDGSCRHNPCSIRVRQNEVSSQSARAESP